ncbi:hypothetical protein KKI19_01260, partial [Patescibacteria group bacterium]|nr:hypothetical protein [Patescibacteria group bacterium]
LVESAQLNGANVIELIGLNHGGLVESTDGQEAIINLLGLSPSEIIPAPEVSYIPSLVFQIASSANLTIIDPDGIMVADSEKLVFIPNPKQGNYQVNVNKEGDGGYFRLLIGKLLPGGDIWQEIEGETTDEPKVYTISFDGDTTKNKLELLSLAKQRLTLLRKKILQLNCPFKHFLASVIKWRIRQIDKAIRLLQREKENRAQREIKMTIFSLIFFEKNLKFWAKLCRFSPEFQQELLEDIRIAKDYLLQAYEFE